MRMWIGCLAAYNCGRLHGEWAEVSTGSDENADAIARVLKASPIAGAEEYLIADYEAPDALARLLGEYPTSEALADAARLLETVEARWPDPDDIDATLSIMLDGMRQRDLADLADGAEDWLADRFAGEGDTLAAWCADLLDETGFFAGIEGAARETVERYFDFESYARDFVLGGDISTARTGGRVLVFWNR
ncbi:MAG: antirestriction protein ArdA [Caulobacteraceae bacterium]